MASFSAMVLDLQCLDGMPNCVDATSPIFGPDAQDSLANAVQSSFEEKQFATVQLFCRCESIPEQYHGTSKETGMIWQNSPVQWKSCSVGIVLHGYKPWSRIMYTKQDFHQAKQESMLRTALTKYCKMSYTDVQIQVQQLPKLYGFDPHPTEPKAMAYWCFKVYFPSFAAVKRFENLWRFKRSSETLFTDFELVDKNTCDATKAMNELGIQMSSWISILEATVSSNRFSTSDVDLVCKSCKSIAPDPLNHSIAPLKITSFDAEMFSHDNCFPDVLKGDCTIAVCATTMVYGQAHLKRIAFVVWPSDVSCGDTMESNSLHDSVGNATIICCESSVDLLDQFRDYIAYEDPDLLTGWNIFGFDMPFMFDEYHSNFTSQKLRGSESTHAQLMRKLEKPFASTAELLDLAKKQKKRIDLEPFRLQRRHALALRDSETLPEVVAAPLRASIRASLCLEPEAVLGGPIDLAQLRQSVETELKDLESSAKQVIVKKQSFVASQVFRDLIDKPRMQSFQRGLYISKNIAEKSVLQEKRMTSSAKGDNCYYFWTGRTSVDLMQIIKDDKKLENNTLKFTAETYLDPNYGKLDMTPIQIFDAYRTKDKAQMLNMLEYCVRDADIPILLLQKLNYVPLWVEMSRVSYTNLHSVLNGGQQRKVYNLLAHFVHDTYAINTGDSEWPQAQESNDSDEEEDILGHRRPDYQGATVIEPSVGFYKEPVSTLDFESLYPSIMIHFNLCPSVYVKPSALGASMTSTLETHVIDHCILDCDGSASVVSGSAKSGVGSAKLAKQPEKYKEFSQQYGFIKNVQGVVPKLLQHLLAARKVAKRAMANAANEFDKSVQNGRQLALKVSCNSVYGFFGCNPKRGMMSCKPVAAVTTLKGRSFIDASKEYVERVYKGAKVLYGDTDSIMIQWSSTPGAISVPRAYCLAEEASEAITKVLRSGNVPGATKPMLNSALSVVTLANEKVYMPYLLLQKKHYAGYKYTLKSNVKGSPDSIDQFDVCMDMKGIDAVRRGGSKLVKELSNTILDALLVQNSLDLALQSVQDSLTLVVENKAPLDWFILSKSLKSSYKTENQPHVQAWKRMIERGDTDIPEIGTRMPYVVVQGNDKLPLYMKTEHPEYVQLKKLRINAKYYLENAKDVVERLLAPTGQLVKLQSMFERALLDSERLVSGNSSLLQFFKRFKTSHSE